MYYSNSASTISTSHFYHLETPQQHPDLAEFLGQMLVSFIFHFWSDT